jgi:hypothetical protein
MGKSDYRDYVYPPGDPGIARWAGHDYREHARLMLEHPIGRDLCDTWATLLGEPFRGVTSDGELVPGLFSRRDEGAPIEAMVAAAGKLVGLLDDERRRAACLPLGASEWREWNNSEIAFWEYGLRLEEQPLHIRDAILAVIAASLSEDGYRTTRHTMWRNEFLGELIAAPQVFNEWSYNFTLFGEVSTAEPWGWQLMGHHLALNCLVIGGQMVLSPVFIGAEPAYLTEGPYAGVAALIDREVGGQELVRALSPARRERAVLYENQRDPRLPPGRLHFADQLHLGGAFHDNRVIPYEGLAGRELAAAERRRLLDLIGVHLRPLPSGPLSARLAEVEEHLDDTHFCWIGQVGGDHPFYYRIQSPVVLIEFDHHSGVLLSNEQPKTFHIHTIVRTPNGNDYGNDLLRQHYEAEDHGKNHHAIAQASS